MTAWEVATLVAKNRLRLALSPEAWFDALLGLTGVCVQFLFANHTLDADPRKLRRGFEPIAVEPQMFDLLIYLVQNRDRVVSKDDLIPRSGAAGSCQIRP
jgi:DNA-binding response OmpR family regulator